MYLSDIDMVDCSTSIGCMTSDLGMMLSGECCINTPEGLAYTKPGSNTCYVCIGRLIEGFRIYYPF